jgi:hypothetical protein
MLIMTYEHVVRTSSSRIELLPDLLQLVPFQQTYRSVYFEQDANNRQLRAWQPRHFETAVNHAVSLNYSTSWSLGTSLFSPADVTFPSVPTL